MASERVQLELKALQTDDKEYVKCVIDLLDAIGRSTPPASSGWRRFCIHAKRDKYQNIHDTIVQILQRTWCPTSLRGWKDVAPVVLTLKALTTQDSHRVALHHVITQAEAENNELYSSMWENRKKRLRLETCEPPERRDVSSEARYVAYDTLFEAHTPVESTVSRVVDMLDVSSSGPSASELRDAFQDLPQPHPPALSTRDEDDDWF